MPPYLILYWGISKWPQGLTLKLGYIYDSLEGYVEKCRGT